MQANVNERRNILKQLGVFNDLMEECLQNNDLERYKRVERDFNDYSERIEYVGKKIN